MKKSLIIFMLAVGMLQAIPILKTGQTTSYENYDDGHYKIGLDRNYTRSDNGVVTDHTLGMKWQDNYDDNSGNIKVSDWNEAQLYCENLQLDGEGWRLPTIHELASTIMYNSSYIDAEFKQADLSRSYWSSTSTSDEVDAPNSAWAVNYSKLSLLIDSKDNANFAVRCIKKACGSVAPKFKEGNNVNRGVKLGSFS